MQWERWRKILYMFLCKKNPKMSELSLFRTENETIFERVLCFVTKTKPFSILFCFVPFSEFSKRPCSLRPCFCDQYINWNWFTLRRAVDFRNCQVCRGSCATTFGRRWSDVWRLRDCRPRCSGSVTSLFVGERMRSFLWLNSKKNFASKKCERV